MIAGTCARTPEIAFFKILPKSKVLATVSVWYIERDGWHLLNGEIDPRVSEYIYWVTSLKIDSDQF